VRDHHGDGWGRAAERLGLISVYNPFPERTPRGSNHPIEEARRPGAPERAFEHRRGPPLASAPADSRTVWVSHRFRSRFFRGKGSRAVQGLRSVDDQDSGTSFLRTARARRLVPWGEPEK